MIFVFANTGQENDETLEFIKKCSDFFGFPVVWIESVVHMNKKKSSTFKITNFESANRTGEVFESVISKYGIPNKKFPHCNRELKLNPIKSYAKFIGWKNYYTAIGIRVDEFDRMSGDRESLKLIYPLVSEYPTTKKDINAWWKKQPFRLNLKGYQGNCKWCWKKTDHKLFTIIKEKPEVFDFPSKMEKQFGNYTPESRLTKMAERGEVPEYPVTFFRGNRSVLDLKNESLNFNKEITDDSEFEESCDVYSGCGDL